MIDQTRKNATTNLSLEGFVGGGCEKNTVEWFIFVPPLCLTVQLPRRMEEEVKKEKNIHSGGRKRNKKSMKATKRGRRKSLSKRLSITFQEIAKPPLP